MTIGEDLNIDRRENLSSPQRSGAVPALRQTSPQTACPFPVPSSQCLNPSKASDFEVLVLIPATSHSAANHSSACRGLTEEATKPHYPQKSRDVVPRPPRRTHYWPWMRLEILSIKLKTRPERESSLGGVQHPPRKCFIQGSNGPQQQTRNPKFPQCTHTKPPGGPSYKPSPGPQSTCTIMDTSEYYNIGRHVMFWNNDKQEMYTLCPRFAAADKKMFIDGQFFLSEPMPHVVRQFPPCCCFFVFFSSLRATVMCSISLSVVHVPSLRLTNENCRLSA